MKRDWKEIEGRAEKAEIKPGTIQQPLEMDNWPQRISRSLHLENDDYPEMLAETPFDLLTTLRSYINRLKGELRTLAQAFQDYKRLHPDTDQSLLDSVLERNSHLREELEDLRKANQVLLGGSSLRDQEIERLRQALVELQDRLDGAKTRG